MGDEGEAPALGRKRKQPHEPANPSNPLRNSKRVRTDKMKDARTILTQASDKALNRNGELDVSAFVKSREFEIKAMEASMGESKKALSSRAFQQVPNELRRRTASHNVKKVPKRLKSRAAREMKEDNTPTVTSRRRKPTPHMRLRLETAKKLQKLHARQKKRHAETKEKMLGEGTDAEKEAVLPPPIRRLKKNILSKPDELPSNIRKRQKHKCWLPTHIWHAKRAHMTEPKHPLWRFAIALSPTEKTYRKTHRAGSLRGCVAWDTSYMGTIQVEGAEASLLGLLRGIGVDEEALSGKKAEKWRRGTRSWQGWVTERDGEKKWIAKVDIIWCIQQELSAAIEETTSKKQPKRRCFLRVHPSAFLQLWTEVLKVAKMQRPPVMAEDLRFEIGSIEVTGPGSTEALIAALEPFAKIGENDTEGISARTWTSLSSVSNPSCLPTNAILGFNGSDPRLRYPPRTTERLTAESANDDLLQILSTWLPDTAHTPPSIFDRTARLTASRLLPSQKAINRRKADAMPGQYPSPAPNDPQIAILLMASRSPTAGAQGSWKVLLPWKCVLPVWYYIMHYPLSTGGNPRFGGLEETRQIALEQEIPWFPGDFPGTQAGWDWETTERDKRKAEWEKRPKGKRVAWESLDLGLGRKGEIGIGWACDWEYVFSHTRTGTDSANTSSRPTTTASSTKANEPPKAAEPQTPNATATPLPPSIHHIPLPHSTTFLTSPNTLPLDSQALTTIHLTLLSRGNPTTCARIYRLPTTSPRLRAQWLALALSILHPPENQTPRRTNPTHFERASVPWNDSHPLRKQQTALSLLAPPFDRTDDGIQPGHPKYPVVPGRDDLVGFVTTGNFDLGRGRARAVGCVAVAKVVHPHLERQGLAEGEGNVPVVDEGVEGREESEARKGVAELEKKLGKKVVGRLCVVRDAGTSGGRLARWELV
ncbi:MAG: hypothetical protein LQ338_003891 [Usnochroma carphineum]|nr:MAG: hypothetical protein LQ338_003891 [Usnochroma carphineum]